MIRMFVRRAVSDFSTWKQAYNAFDAEHAGMGVRGHATFQGADDPNEVPAWHDFDTVDVARVASARSGHSGRLQRLLRQRRVTGCA